MQYSRVEVFRTSEPVVIRREENVTRLEVINMLTAPNNYVDVGGVVLTGEAGRNRILFDAGEGRVFNQDFIIRDYCDTIQCYLFDVLVIKTIYE